MKLFILFIITTMLPPQSNMSYSQTHITINLENEVLERVIDEIEAQSKFKFIFNTNAVDLKRDVTLKVNNLQIEKVLEQLFTGTKTRYEIVDHKILLTDRKQGTSLNQENNNPQLRLFGTVTDEQNKPLPGVTIRIKNTNIGVATDSEGKYVIPVMSPKSVLVFTILGFKSQEIVVGNKTRIDVKMTISVDELEEVVVVSTGYQKVKKEQLTGAASVVGANELSQRTIVSGNFLESLEGRLPGLVYNYRNPNTPEDERLTIRGVATFDGVKQPLIVIDGFPTEIDINSINPNIIASVSVLRDAAASTIYGARAANGVIVIETLRGEAGKPGFTFRNSVAIQPTQDFNDLNYADSREYIAIKKAIATNSTQSRPSSTSIQFDPVRAIIYDQRDGLISEAVANNMLEELGRYNNLEQYKKLFYRPSFIQNYELGMSGGGESNTYRINLNYIDHKTNEEYSDNNRLIFNLNDNYQISNRITLDISGIYTYEKNMTRGDIPTYSTLLPYMPLIDENGNPLPDYNYLQSNEEVNKEAMSLGLHDRWQYPYGDFLTERYTSRKNAFRIQARLNIELMKGLSLELGGAYEYDNRQQDLLYEEENYEVRSLLNKSAQADPSTGNALFVHVPQGDLLQKQDHKIKGYTYRVQFDADYSFGNNKEHQISGILGAELRKTETSSYLTSFFGYDGQTLNLSPVDLQLLTSRGISSGFPQFRFGTASINLDNYFNEAYTDRRFRSFYSHATYILKDKYIATGSIRLDQSNLFGTDPKYRNKPQWSAGLSWLLHRESFMRDISGWLSEFKLRGAYGLTGNVPTSNSGKFLILQTLRRAFLTPAVFYNSIKAPENQSLRWENTRNLNIGIDYGLFGRRLTGTVDWYRKKSISVLGSTLADPTTGWSNYLANTATIENNGIEVSLNSRNIISNKFSWSTNVTASYNKNTIVEVYTPNPNSYRGTYYVNTDNPIENYALNSLLSFRYAGLNADGIPTMLNNLGEVQTLSSSSDIYIEDLVNSGTTTPKYVLGMGNQLRIGDFKLFAMLMYYGGHVTRVAPPDIEAGYPLKGTSDYWKAPGDEVYTEIPGLRPPFGDPNYSAYSFGRTIYSRADSYVRKADEVRLTDITLTWDLNASLLSGLKFFDTQLRFQAQNVWRHTFSGNDIDMDAINPVTGERGLSTQPVYSVQLITKF